MTTARALSPSRAASAATATAASIVSHAYQGLANAALPTRGYHRDESQSISLGEIHDQNQEEDQNLQGLLANLTKAARYPAMELRGLMASMTDSAIDLAKGTPDGDGHEETTKPAANFQKASQILELESRGTLAGLQKPSQNPDLESRGILANLQPASRNSELEARGILANLQKASRNSVLELRGMLASINSISHSFHLDESITEHDMQGLLENLSKASETSEMELRGMLASLEFDEEDDNSPEVLEKKRESYMRIQKISRDSFFELRGLLVGLEKVAKNGSANKLSRSIREQLTLQPLDELTESY